MTKRIAVCSLMLNSRIRLRGAMLSALLEDAGPGSGRSARDRGQRLRSLSDSAAALNVVASGTAGAATPLFTLCDDSSFVGRSYTIYGYEGGCDRAGYRYPALGWSYNDFARSIRLHGACNTANLHEHANRGGAVSGRDLLTPADRGGLTPLFWFGERPISLRVADLAECRPLSLSLVHPLQRCCAVLLSS
ncbi:hypothetical protein ACFYYY_22435 [Streptomyces sp. NPDC001834]|uniref:hypothetical protein n=1 Tax=Streptomyces sp. NPDC001834 TaxID=3364616 RepID=UPI0036C645E2